ncbi:MAG TPA: sialate O-acetylesterase [Planctomycetaceae bacterium]|nr:sialate O-acetylesterase [Planctomycetaceae bacterium]
MRFGSVFLAATIGCAILQNAKADVELPNVFSDHMVLQQKQENKVWGRAKPGESVTVTFRDQSHSATADAAGNWHVMLEAEEASHDPATLTAKGSSTVTIEDVLVGEVWICSGQSNMQWSVSQTNDPDLVKVSANYPLIRMINYPRVGAQSPVWTHPKHQWMVCSPETVGSFSAVGYFFGRQLHQVLDVPIGLINNAWGGSACEAWIARDVMEETGDYAYRLKVYDDMAQQLDDLTAKKELSADEKKRKASLTRNLTGNHRPANIYNGVLKSHLGYGIRGAIWYQGESNAGRAYQYRKLFPLMIASWREEWGQGDFPFYWVQLADFRAESEAPGESNWAELREAQTMTMDKLANTGEAVIIDIGEGKDIHPRNKVDVGRRLARWALAKQYGVDIAYQSPRYKSMEQKDGKITLSFDAVRGGWRPFDVKSPVGFAIAGEDRKFVWAEAKIVNDTIEVWSDAVSEPVAVRYGWADNPVCNMFTGLNLPLTPFRTDDWPGITVDAK